MKVENLMKHTVPLSSVHVGDILNLKDYGFDEPVTVFKIYEGQPSAQDTLSNQYDLSQLEPIENDRDEEGGGDLTLIVARKSGDRASVIYVSDAEREVERSP